MNDLNFADVWIQFVLCTHARTTPSNTVWPTLESTDVRSRACVFLACPKKRVDFTESIDALLSESESESEMQSFDVLSEIIEKAALDLQPRGERNRPDWFSENETKLFEAIERRNEAYNESTKDPSSNALKHKLRHCRKLLQNVIKSSKATWLSKKAK
jgi:hypothetical protein